MSEYQVGIRDLKARLSEYLRRVKQGDVIVITEHGKPVGRIVPEEKKLDERMHRLADAGVITWRGQKLEDIEPVVSIKGDKTIADLIIEDRE